MKHSAARNKEQLYVTSKSKEHTSSKDTTVRNYMPSKEFLPL